MALNRWTYYTLELEKLGNKEMSLIQKKREHMKNNKWYRNNLLIA